MHISNLLDKAVRLWPDKDAVVCGKNRFTYSQFAHRSKALAKVFMKLGLEPGERVAILHRNCHIYLEAYFAAAYAGVILTPINFRLAGPELAFILNDSGAKLLIAHSEFADKVAIAMNQEPNELDLETVIWTGEVGGIPRIEDCPAANYEQEIAEADDDFSELPEELPGDAEPAHLYYTSGTTGKPKGVILTHANIVTHAIGTVTELQLTGSDVWGHIAPLYHLADAWATFAITMVGGKHVMVPKFEPGVVLETIHEEGITLSNLIPTMLNLLVNEPGARGNSYPNLRYILSGGAPIAPELVRKIIEAFGCEYVQTYGMTETSPYLTMSLLNEHLKKLPAEQRFYYQSRTGRKFTTIDLKVVRNDGSEVTRDNREVGEIWVRGPTITPGYWHRPEETDEAFQDGWFKTGDLAVIDPEGYVNIVDRKKDLIVTGGENVYSTEVEHVLYEHSAVLEVAVVGVPDEKWGEAVKAIVVVKNGMETNEDELIEFCRERLAGFKTPKSVEFVNELPKTGSGKISKKELKDKYWAGEEKRVH